MTTNFRTDRRRTHQRLLGLASAALLAPLGSARAQAGKLPAVVRIGFQKGSPTLVIARKRQNIEARLKTLGVPRVEWVEFQFGPPMLEAIGAGAVDLGSVGDTPPIFAQAGGAHVVYAAETPSAEHGVLVPEHSPLKQVSDLKGKRVAIPKGSSAHNVTLTALRLARLPFEDITPVYLAPAEATAAFVSGAVDAWVVWDPYFALAEAKYGARTLTDTTRDPRLASHSFYIGNRQFAEQYPETLNAVLAEIGEIVRWSAQHRDEVAAVAAEATGLDLGIQKRAFQRAQFGLGPVSPATLKQQQTIADAFLQQKLIPKPIDVSAIWWKAADSIRV